MATIPLTAKVILANTYNSPNLQQAVGILYAGTSQSIPDSTNTEIVSYWTGGTSAYYSNSSIITSGTNSGRIKVLVTGTYLCSANLSYNGNTTGIRRVDISVNGTTTYAETYITAGTGGQPISVSTTTIIRLNANDYVSVFGLQNSGGNLAMNISMPISFSVMKIF